MAREHLDLSTNVVEMRNIVKKFGDFTANDGINLTVHKGDIHAILGENGAGKSTTISILCGQLSKDGGSVKIGGKKSEESAEEIKRELGVVFQNSVLDKALSVRDNLQSRAALYCITGQAFEERLAALAHMFEFENLLKRSVGKLSGGQKRRIDVARALLHRPRILVLDEPTTGLDPQTRKTVWEIVNGLRRTENMTVFLTTHYMEEAAEADYVVILDSGKIAAEGTPLDLKNRYTGDFIYLYNVSEERVLALGIGYESVPGGYRIEVKNTAAATQLIAKVPELFCDYEVLKGKMDDVFLAVTGKKLQEGETV